MKYLILALILFFFASCIDLGDWYYGYGGKATGVVVKIPDSTADYGLIGSYNPYDSLANNIDAKFRFSKANKYNKATYEGDTITIDSCQLSFDSLNVPDWEMILYDYISY